MTDPVRVTVAVPLAADLAARIGEGHADVVVVHEPDLLPPPRFPGDHAGEAGFTRSGSDEARFQALLADTDVTFGFPGDSPAGLAALVHGAPRLRWVHGTAAGAGEQARRAGLTAGDLDRVALTTSAGVHGATLAEFAMFGLLAGARDLPRLQDQQRAHAWPLRRPSRELAGRRLLVLGLGGIGRQVAALAAGLGMRVSGVRRDPAGPPVPHVERTYGPDELATALAATDDVVLALPGTDETAAVVGAAELALLADGATVVNVGRGTALDETALLVALDGGGVGYAALDVTAVEPLPTDSPLWDHPRVLISPHTAALSVHEDARIVELFRDNLARFLAGDPLRNRVRADRWY